MSRFLRLAGRIRSWPGVPQLRHVAEKAFAPYLRADLNEINRAVQARAIEDRSRFEDLERRIGEEILASTDILASTSASLRLLRRELLQLEKRMDAVAAHVEMSARLREDVDAAAEQLAVLQDRVVALERTLVEGGHVSSPPSDLGPVGSSDHHGPEARSGHAPS